MKKTLLILSVIALLFSFGACEKKEEKIEAKSKAPSGPIIDVTVGGGISGQKGEKKIEFTVVVPQEVKDSWASAVFVIDDKQEGKQTEVTVIIGEEFKIPDSSLVVKTGPFLPDFKMSAETITSTSNNPVNPAIGVEIYDDGEKVFPASGKWGWLYANFPSIHTFEHSRYGLSLKEGNQKP